MRDRFDGIRQEAILAGDSLRIVKQFTLSWDLSTRGVTTIDTPDYKMKGVFRLPDPRLGGFSGGAGRDRH